MKFFINTFFLSLIVSTLIAQNHNDSSVTIIFHKQTVNKKQSTKKKSAENSILKIAPTGIFVGQLPILFEKKLTDNISIQGGLGITMQNYIRASLASIEGISNGSNNYKSRLPWEGLSTSQDEVHNIYDFTVRNTSVGTMFTIQPKFYFNEEAIDGSYIGFSFSSANYKFTIPKASYSNATFSLTYNGPNINEFEKMTDFMLHLGHQNIYNHFSFEYSTAIGIRRISGEKYAATYDTKFYDGMLSYSKSVFNFEIAIRIGYVF